LVSGLRRRITGISPHDFVRPKPLEHPRKLLKIIELGKNEPVHSVANAIGHAGMHGSNDRQAASHGFRDWQTDESSRVGATA